MLNTFFRAAASGTIRLARRNFGSIPQVFAAASSSGAFCPAKAQSWSEIRRLTTAATAAILFTAASAAYAEEACAANPQQNQRSFIMIKPDGVQRGLIADIVARFERKGYKLVGLKIVLPSKELSGDHYAEHNGKPFFPKLVNFLSSGPVIAMVWEGKEVISYGRTLIGATNPLTSTPGTIRGDFGIDVGRNIIHGSDSVDSAQREIALWFSSEELVDYPLASQAYIYE